MKKRIFTLCICAALMLMLFGCNTDGFCRGTISDNVYKNEFAGITFTALEGWEFLSDDEIAQKTDVSKELLKDDTFRNMEEGFLPDMMAGNEDNTAVAEVAFYKGVNFPDLETGIQVQTNQIRKFYEKRNYTVSVSERETATLGSREYQKLEILITAGENVFKLFLYMAMQDGYFVTVNITAANGDGADAFETMFS